MNQPRSARFSVGQVVEHRLFGYRGVIYDVDPVFMLSDDWYRKMAKSRPPKDEPWYRVLVHDESHETYVAEQNLDCDPDASQPVRHPRITILFGDPSDGRYPLRAQGN